MRSSSSVRSCSATRMPRQPEKPAWTGLSRALLAVIAGLILPLESGCLGIGDSHRENKIPHLGEIDPAQPHELQMASLPPYTVEPPDELEISAKPAAIGLPIITPNVQADGMIDLGYFGDVYVSGLSLCRSRRRLRFGSHSTPRAEKSSSMSRSRSRFDWSTAARATAIMSWAP